MKRYAVKSKIVMTCYDIVEASSVEDAMDAVKSANNMAPLHIFESTVDIQDVVEVKSFKQYIRDVFDNPPANYVRRLMQDFLLRGK